MLYEMCNYEVPFDAPTEFATGKKILYEPHVPVNEYIHTKEI